MAAVYSSLFHLSPREVQVLRLLVEGKRNKEIGCALCLAERTVEHHVDSILRKLEARNRTEAALHALQAGLIWSQPELGTSTQDAPRPLVYSAIAARAN